MANASAKPLASLSSTERSELKATLDGQHEVIKGCFAEALAADGSYASLVPLHDAIVVNFETEEQYQLDGEHPPDHVLLRDDLKAAMAKAGQGGQTGAAWVRRFRAKYDAHDEAFDEPAFGSLQAPSSSPCRSPAPPRDPPLPPHYLTLRARRAAYLAPIGRGVASLPSTKPLTPKKSQPEIGEVYFQGKKRAPPTKPPSRCSDRIKKMKPRTGGASTSF